LPDNAARRPTSVDVAREAGLSRATVSYVLNGVSSQRIPEATRQRVLDAAARLNYQPSSAARALRSGRSDLVLMLLPDWPIGQQLGGSLRAISDALAARGLTFVTHPRAAHDRPLTDLWRSITPSIVITYEPLDLADRAAVLAAGSRDMVLLLSAADGLDGGLMASPQQRIGRLQVEHLASRGHVRLGYAMPDDDRLRSFAEPRLEGVRQGCAEFELDEPEIRTVPLDASGAAEALSTWDKSVTAVCAYNDDVGLAILAGARRIGRRVPDDLAVVGVDNTLAGALADPSLTSIVTDQVAVSAYIADAVVAAIADQPMPQPLPGTVVDVVARASS
jgi:DNA-binding LacI/PurR family transcriptional regulator